jgi:DNA-binding CsgD family transcriptional regulator
VLSDATGSVGAGLVPLRAGTRFPLLHNGRLAPMNETYLRDGWVQRDVRFRCVPALLRRGASAEFDFITADEIAIHPYYQEWLAPHGLRWFSAVKIAFGEEIWALSIQRSIAQGPFSPAEVDHLAELSKGLASAGALARALGFARAEAALAAFEVSGLAVALVDRLGKVVRLNAAAELLIGSDLKIVRGRIVCADRDAAAAFDRALHALLRSGSGPALESPVVVPRAGKRPLLAYATRPPAICADAIAECQAVVVLIEPAASPPPPEAHLKGAFGLTTAEARLASRLATGESLADAADALGVTKETARELLKRVFAKTDVHRQAELVALLAPMSRRP